MKIKSLRARVFGVIEGRREVLHALQLFGKDLHPASAACRMTSKMSAFSEKERLHSDVPRAWKRVEEQV
jgi:hypothetical protein